MKDVVVEGAVWEGTGAHGFGTGAGAGASGGEGLGTGSGWLDEEEAGREERSLDRIASTEDPHLLRGCMICVRCWSQVP